MAGWAVGWGVFLLCRAVWEGQPLSVKGDREAVAVGVSGQAHLVCHCHMASWYHELRPAALSQDLKAGLATRNFLLH